MVDFSGITFNDKVSRNSFVDFVETIRPLEDLLAQLSLCHCFIPMHFFIELRSCEVTAEAVVVLTSYFCGNGWNLHGMVLLVNLSLSGIFK